MTKHEQIEKEKKERLLAIKAARDEKTKADAEEKAADEEEKAAAEAEEKQINVINFTVIFEFLNYLIKKKFSILK